MTYSVKFSPKLKFLAAASKQVRPAAVVLLIACCAGIFCAAQDAVRIYPQSPPPNTPLSRGRPVVFRLAVDYTLESANSAIMSISVAQIPSSAGGCGQNNAGELVNAVDIPIGRGSHHLETSLEWQGDTGVGTNGRVFGSGWVAFVPMFWTNNNGQRGARFRMFPRVWCYTFAEGPAPEPEFPVRGFFGSWLNNDPQTRDITRIVVSRRGNDIEVHAWGACHPQDCDWGEVRGDLSGNVCKPTGMTRPQGEGWSWSAPARA